jgi:hypothetical protein
VLRNTNFYLGQKAASFAEAFPTVKTVRAEVTELGRDWRNIGEPWVYSESNFVEFVDCHNGLCFDGGVGISDLLREMTWKHESHGRFTKLCRGNEASAKGHKIYRRCVHEFTVQLDVEYRE